MSEAKSCGLVAAPTDNIERLALITIRYLAWIGEAISSRFPAGQKSPPSNATLTLLASYFDRIEHIVQNSFEVNMTAPLRASFLMDNITVMKVTLETHVAEIHDCFDCPTLDDLEALHIACQNLRGRNMVKAPAFG